MGRAKPWWKERRVKHRDAVALCVLSSSLLLAGELAGPANPALREIYDLYIAPVLDRPAILLLNAVLAVLAFTTAFGAMLVFLGGWYFMRGRIPRGRFFVGFGVGLTSLGLINRLAYATLVFGTPLAFLLPLAATFTGLGILVGVIAHAVMGQYALFLKRHANQAWRRWRRSHRTAPRRGNGRRRWRSARLKSS
jgi:hypothetical protein